jgi:hypothetical protein
MLEKPLQVGRDSKVHQIEIYPGKNDRSWQRNAAWANPKHTGWWLRTRCGRATSRSNRRRGAPPQARTQEAWGKDLLPECPNRPYGGLRDAQVAAMGTSTGAVKTHLWRAIASLRTVLAPRGSRPATAAQPRPRPRTPDLAGEADAGTVKTACPAPSAPGNTERKANNAAKRRHDRNLTFHPSRANGGDATRRLNRSSTRCPAPGGVRGQNTAARSAEPPAQASRRPPSRRPWHLSAGAVGGHVRFPALCSGEA